MTATRRILLVEDDAHIADLLTLHLRDEGMAVVHCARITIDLDTEATVTLSDAASDEAGRTLAERHDRADLLAGVDLTEQDDMVARVLMDMARTETEPRVDRLAEALVTAIQVQELRMHRRPRQEAGFSVLKSPDIPSVLVELGFLSSDRDLKRLQDPAWRAKMAAALREGLRSWAKDEAARAGMR